MAPGTGFNQCRYNALGQRVLSYSTIVCRETMIKDKEVASRVSDLMLELGAKLNESLVLVKERCTEQEFKAYRTVVGKLMGEMLLEVMNPLYVSHPDLKPKELL